jgi:hypothetical protein
MNDDRLQILGAVLCRAGRFEEAGKRLTEAGATFQKTKTPGGSIIYGSLFQVITQYRLGNTPEANKWLQLAVNDIEQPSQGERARVWNRRLTLRLLRSEVETLLRKGTEVTPSGKELD